MADLTALTLPVLPLSSGVVLPQMVVTIALETDEAKAAVEAAGADDRLLLVPRMGDRYATVGAIARIEDRGQLPNGTPALVVRAEGRAQVGTGVVGTGRALWVQAEPVEDPEPSERTTELAREYRAAAGLLLERLGGRGMSSMLRDVESPGALADTAGWWPDLALETDEAKAAVDAVGADDRLLLVPRLGDRYATVGAIARIEDRGQLPNGTPALVVRAEGRAQVGTGVVGTGRAL
ncbi:MAG: LON peptidase substrate-binding domain-containing protein, partial [Acidimicrobiales bacterium]